MNKKPKPLQLADEHDDDEWIAGTRQWREEAAGELRRLHSVNVELLEALKLALSSHGVMLLSDPPQEAWKTYGVEAKARGAIAKATGDE